MSASVLPPQTQEGAGFETPFVRQFTIFMENKVGLLQQLVRAYEEENRGRIVALSVQDLADTALVRMVCSDSEVARHVLQREQLASAEQELLAVELPLTSKHPLMAVCGSLLAAEINIHYSYPLMVRPAGPALVMCVDDPILASQILMRKGFTLLAESDLKKTH